MTDRIIHLRILDYLRANQFSTAEQIAEGTGLDIEIIKEALTELYQAKRVKLGGA